MATAKRTTATLRNSRHNQVSLSPPSGGRIADSATCQVDFLFPTRHVQFSYLDTINVTYRSELANPALSCWCGAPGRATQKFRDDNVNPFSGSVLVLLNFASDNPCWFHLGPDSGDCGATSERFLVSPAIPSQRSARIAPTSPLTARADVATSSQEPSSSGDSFSTGAKAALGVGIALACIGIGAMAAFLYFRRRRRAQDAADLAGAIYDHDRRRGRKAPEKNRNGASSVTSGRSDEPLCPIQPVPDGFPGSMGYDDVRSLHTTNSHSPTGVSPTLSHNGGGSWGYERSTEREELTAARLKSQLQPSAPAVVSYGPNPVTPTLKSTSRVDLTLPGTVFPDPIETLPQHDFPVKPLPDYADYTVYSIPSPTAAAQPEAANPCPQPKKPAGPIVVSYGPHKVTPTPLVTSPTVPPDEALVNRRIMMMEAAAAAGSLSAVTSLHEQRRFSWEADSPLLGGGGGGVSLGPLPPYASTEDFEAMEKGAVRTLAEPQAEAELPPTKDGFYHYMSDAVEYELPGAAPQREPQLPFRPYQKALAAAAASQVAGGGPLSLGAAAAGGGGGGGGGLRRNNMLREIDEQKFLLSDEEITKMRALKAKARAAAAAPKASQEAEEDDLGEPRDRR